MSIEYLIVFSAFSQTSQTEKINNLFIQLNTLYVKLLPDSPTH